MVAGKAIAAVLLVIVISGSIYFYDNGELANLSSRLNISKSQTATAACSVSQPLSLVSTKASLSSAYLGGVAMSPELYMVWSNCSNEQVLFDIEVSYFSISYSTFGTIAQQSGSNPDVSEACSNAPPGATGGVGPHSTTTVCLVIYPNESGAEISLNAHVVGYSGTVTAIDTNAGTIFSPEITPLSSTSTFTCSSESCPVNAAVTSISSSTSTTSSQVESQEISSQQASTSSAVTTTISETHTIDTTLNEAPQSVIQTTSGSKSAAFSSDVTSGDTILVFVAQSVGTITISDSEGNAYVLAGSTSHSTSCGTWYDYAFYATARTTGPDNVTMSAGGGGMLLFEVSGIGAQDGKSVVGMGSSTTGQTSTLSYTTGDFLVGAIRAVCTSPTVSAGPGFTYVSQSGAEWVGAQYISSAGVGYGSFPFAMGSISQWDEVGMAFTPEAVSSNSA